MQITVTEIDQGAVDALADACDQALRVLRRQLERRGGRAGDDTVADELEYRIEAIEQCRILVWASIDRPELVAAGVDAGALLPKLRIRPEEYAQVLAELGIEGEGGAGEGGDDRSTPRSP